MHERVSHVEYIPDLEQMTRKKRVCAYARVSGDRDEAFHSLSAQISYYQKLIAEHSDWEFVEVFSDRGITGTKEDRPGFQAMLTACREGRVDIVLAKSITRFARNTVILLETVRELKSLGIDIHFEEEHIHTLSSQGELMISLLAARAQEESRSASENQKWRIKKCYEKGIPVTGNCLGYRMVDHQFLIVEEEEQLVQRIFSMYLSGMGVTAIAKKLSAENVPSRSRGKKWSVTGIRRLLSNEKYCGELVLQKAFVSDHLSKKVIKNRGERPQYKVENNHDPIISKSDFEKVQQILSQRAKNTKHEKPANYPFSGMITCCYCGKHYGRKYNGSGTAYKKPTWYCKTANVCGKDVCSATKQIPEDILTEKTCEVLGIEALDEAVLHEKISCIEVPEKNVLVYHFKNGSEKRVKWQYRSRRESWTPEMKEKARQKSLAQHAAKRKKGGGKECR